MGLFVRGTSALVLGISGSWAYKVYKCVGYWLEVKSELVLYIIESSLNLPLYILFAFVVELDPPAQYGCSALLECRCEIYISGDNPLVEKVDHAFVDVVLGDRGRVVAGLEHGRRCLRVLLHHSPFFVLVNVPQGTLGGIASTHGTLLQDTRSTARVLAYVRVKHHWRLIIACTLLGGRMYVREAEVRQVLLCAAEILHHSGHQ